ncbi:MAG: transposase [Bacteroidales bacterium]|nr:transposase [Bacteroidales bacterium]
MSDTYTCPQGKKLHLFSKGQKQRKVTYDFNKCNECDGCPIRNNCTSSKKGRTYKRNIDQNEIEQYKQKLTTQYSKERIAERKGIVEHPFGTIEWLMGKFNFLLTGKEKAQIEFDLYTTAYNIKRLINSEINTKLIDKMMKYSWTLA